MFHYLVKYPSIRPEDIMRRSELQLKRVSNPKKDTNEEVKKENLDFLRK